MYMYMCIYIYIYIYMGMAGWTKGVPWYAPVSRGMGEETVSRASHWPEKG